MSLTQWERKMLEKERPIDPPDEYWREEVICSKCGRVIGEDENVYYGLCKKCWKKWKEEKE